MPSHMYYYIMENFKEPLDCLGICVILVIGNCFTSQD